MHFGVIAQLARAPALQAGGCGIVPHWLHKVTFTGYKRDAGSIPVLRETVVSLMVKQ